MHPLEKMLGGDGKAQLKDAGDMQEKVINSCWDIRKMSQEGSEAESELQLDISIQEEEDHDSGSCMSQLGPCEAGDGACTLFMCPKT